MNLPCIIATVGLLLYHPRLHDWQCPGNWQREPGRPHLRYWKRLSVGLSWIGSRFEKATGSTAGLRLAMEPTVGLRLALKAGARSEQMAG